jgi:hypothetical protein
MVYLSQQDPRWVNKKYDGNYTIGRYGCTITDVAMFYDWAFGKAQTPDWIASQLKFSNGLLLWNSLSNIGLKFVYRYYSRDDNRIAQALASPVEGCLIEVNHNHWLFLTGKKTVQGWKVADPWHGDSCYTNRYQDNITGFCVISK